MLLQVLFKPLGADMPSESTTKKFLPSLQFEGRRGQPI
jgi:hypothetical protein